MLVQWILIEEGCDNSETYSLIVSLEGYLKTIFSFIGKIKSKIKVLLQNMYFRQKSLGDSSSMIRRGESGLQAKNESTAWKWRNSDHDLDFLAWNTSLREIIIPQQLIYQIPNFMFYAFYDHPFTNSV